MAICSSCRLSEDPGATAEIEVLVTLLYMLIISHEGDHEFMDELGMDLHEAQHHSVSALSAPNLIINVLY